MEIPQRVVMNVLEDADIYADGDARPRWEYSGRCMYGRTCFALVGDVADLARFVYQCGVREERASWEEQEYGYDPDAADPRVDWLEFTQRIRSDSMGHSTVWYWPNVQVTDVAPDEDEDDED